MIRIFNKNRFFSIGYLVVYQDIAQKLYKPQLNSIYILLNCIILYKIGIGTIHADYTMLQKVVQYS